MSTIHLVPEVLEHLHKSQGATTQGAVYDSPPRPLRTNQELVHAWSIGVTGVSRHHADPSQPHSDQQSHETCPPEVYIG